MPKMQTCYILVNQELYLIIDWFKVDWGIENFKLGVWGEEEKIEGEKGGRKGSGKNV